MDHAAHTGEVHLAGSSGGASTSVTRGQQSFDVVMAEGFRSGTSDFRAGMVPNESEASEKIRRATRTTPGRASDAAQETPQP